VTAAGPGVPGDESVAQKARAADGLRRIAEEQAALRRVAVLVAQGEAPEEIFAAVAAEAGQVLDAEHAFIGRYDPDGRHASIIDVQVESGEGELHVCVRDDGRGGAHVGGGSGLAGLKDRVEALGGRFSLDSPPGAGTALDIVLPLSDRQAGSSPLGHQPFA
jgi:signal transduction histidine kinase